ncbi:MAG: hypothetical protein PHV34_04995 [Verrucomicrobiae bacterium]|nr:hypothetical protein [Verrucomicrobiae bacterium]
MKIALLRLSLIAILFSKVSGATNNLEYTCIHLSEEPVIDGRIDERVWHTIPVSDGFYVPGNQAPAQKQTYFRAGWTSNALYMAVHALEPNPQKIERKLRDGELVSRDDSIQFFCVSEGCAPPPLFCVAANADGARFVSGRVMKSSTKLHNLIDAAAIVGKDFWTLELKIPSTILEMPFPPQGRWRANVVRNIRTGPPSESVTSWVPTLANFHAPSDYGFFIFTSRTAFEKDACEMNVLMARPCGVLLKERVAKWAQLSGKYLSELKRVLDNDSEPEFQKEGNALETIWNEIRRVGGGARISAPEIYHLASQCNDDLIEATETLIAKIILKEIFRDKSRH